MAMEMRTTITRKKVTAKKAVAAATHLIRKTRLIKGRSRVQRRKVKRKHLLRPRRVVGRIPTSQTRRTPRTLPLCRCRRRLGAAEGGPARRQGGRRRVVVGD